jgi:hypothetical protein
MLHVLNVYEIDTRSEFCGRLVSIMAKAHSDRRFLWLSCVYSSAVIVDKYASASNHTYTCFGSLASITTKRNDLGVVPSKEPS